MDKDKVVLLIPSLNPDEKLINLVKELKEKEFDNIVIVNDGSKQECLHYFEILENDYNCKIFSHFRNLGKGRALKNAFNFILTNFEDFKTVITLDSDGQHKVKDVISLAERFETVESNTLGLGCRKFGQKDVPFRSKFGNIFTRMLLKVLCGISVSDTQTGLRAFTKDTMKEFMDIPGERFEYEMNMILATKNKDIKIVECPIETVYIEENKSSHFNPIKDSFKIISRLFAVFFKYTIASILSFLIDLGFFALFVAVTKNWVSASLYIILSTIFARVISSVFNFLVNKNTVFKQKDKSPKFFIMYFTLVIVNMVLSAVLVDVFVKFCSFPEIWAKVLVDGTLFILSFVLQRDVIFRATKKKKAKLKASSTQNQTVSLNNEETNEVQIQSETDNVSNENFSKNAVDSKNDEINQDIEGGR